MYYGEIKNCDIADGLGVRVSLFVSGCRNHCKGCFNQMTWDFLYGKEFDQETINKIIELFEPENQPVLVELLRLIKKTYPNKNIWCYTGYILDKDLLKESRVRTPYTDEMLSYIDILVDGPFIIEKKNIMLKFRGSTNQRVIDLKKTLKENKIILFLE